MKIIFAPRNRNLERSSLTFRFSCIPLIVRRELTLTIRVKRGRDRVALISGSKERICVKRCTDNDKFNFSLYLRPRSSLVFDFADRLARRDIRYELYGGEVEGTGKGRYRPLFRTAK